MAPMSTSAHLVVSAKYKTMLLTIGRDIQCMNELGSAVIFLLSDSLSRIYRHRL